MQGSWEGGGPALAPDGPNYGKASRVLLQHSSCTCSGLLPGGGGCKTNAEKHTLQVCAHLAREWHHESKDGGREYPSGTL